MATDVLPTGTPIKGTPVTVIENFQTALPASPGVLLAASIDVRDYNAVNITVFIPAGFTCNVEIDGSENTNGNYLPLSDGQAVQSGLNANKSFDVVCGRSWAKVRLLNVTVPGGAIPGQGITIIAQAYVSPGGTTVNVSNNASQNIAQISGANVGLGNPLPIRLSDGAAAIAILPTSSSQLPPTLGQKAMASSAGVTIASDQTPVPMSQARGAKTFTAVTVPATAGGILLLAANAARKEATIVNNGAASVYLGKDNTVTVANGLPLAAGQALSDKYSSDAWWGITASGTVDARVEETA